MVDTSRPPRKVLGVIWCRHVFLRLVSLGYSRFLNQRMRMKQVINAEGHSWRCQHIGTVQEAAQGQETRPLHTCPVKMVNMQGTSFQINRPILPSNHVIACHPSSPQNGSLWTLNFPTFPILGTSDCLSLSLGTQMDPPTLESGLVLIDTVTVCRPCVDVVQGTQ